jgi:hypothetical protein
MNNDETYDDPSTIKLSHERPLNPPLRQDWPERPPTLGELGARAVAHAEEAEPVAVLRRTTRKTPSERKVDALGQAVLLAREAIDLLEKSLDEFSIQDAPAAQEEDSRVLPPVTEYLNRLEQRHARTK